MADEELVIKAYLAGVMDADGYFCFKRTPPEFGSDGGMISTARYSECVGLNQVTDEVILILKARYGGNIAHYAARTTHARPMYRWRVSGKKTAVITPGLLPFLRVKRREGEPLLVMRAGKDRPRFSTRTPGDL